MGFSFSSGERSGDPSPKPSGEQAPHGVGEKDPVRPLQVPGREHLLGGPHRTALKELPPEPPLQESALGRGGVEATTAERVTRSGVVPTAVCGPLSGETSTDTSPVFPRRRRTFFGPMPSAPRLSAARCKAERTDSRRKRYPKYRAEAARRRRWSERNRNSLSVVRRNVSTRRKSAGGGMRNCAFCRTSRNSSLVRASHTIPPPPPAPADPFRMAIVRTATDSAMSPPGGSPPK